MGSGTFVVEDGPSPKSVLRTRAALIGEHSPLDISHARLLALEPVVAAQAALNRHDSDIATLRLHVEAHTLLVTDGDDPEQPDLDFHLALANATYNRVLVDLVERLVEIMSPTDMEAITAHGSYATPVEASNAGTAPTPP